jgi:uncharacterized protein
MIQSVRADEYKIETLVLQPTPFCNIDCSYCYLRHRESRARMTELTIERAFERVFSSPFIGEHLTLLWHAGEPLALGVDYYRRAFKLLERHKPHNVDVTCHFQTNGTLLSQQWVDLFKEQDARIGVSLDGPAELHDLCRKTRSGRGTFDQTMRGLQILKANDFPFHVITVLTRESLRSAARLFEFYLENGITQVAFNVEEIEGVHTNSSLQSTEAELQLRAFFTDFLDLTTRHEPRISVREFDGALQSIINRSSEDYGNPMAEPMRFISIGVNGELSTFSPELLDYTGVDNTTYAFGNVHENELAEMLNHPAFLRVRSEIETGLQACRDSCEYFQICRGGVPGNKLFENGSFATSETMFCRLSKKAVVDVVLKNLENELGIFS